ncbi:response regulator transcription factor [Modestobacter marinus]|uniref:DNA-binding NarL/FixJ family response regulator n=1 Tax=Modestobacter marinus TaxID=477641 RepID=A0A846LLW2_9ACTN|nr:response regulator transcription factor [Modestobacter marinus]NIH68596.1 DNA-binding NarL/FixJ family response regulator [Modestobacter marinus]GGL58486.1 DNA-binding response regulator [Modestobacter marinus]
MTRVMLVDDQEMIRAGLRAIIGAHPKLEVVAEAGDGLAVLRQLDEARPDVVLMDIRMPGIDGVEATRRIRLTRPAEQLRILVLTTFDQDENVLQALRAGADGFLSKGAGPTELTDAILSVAAGARALSPSAVSAVVEHVVQQRPVDVDPAMAARFAGLTPREREVVAAIAAGLDAAEIAERFFLSPFTVKTHANRAMTKVRARDRAQLVAFAIRAGISPQ